MNLRLIGGNKMSLNTWEFKAHLDVLFPFISSELKLSPASAGPESSAVSSLTLSACYIWGGHASTTFSGL
jgi:hypothetical protein